MGSPEFETATAVGKSGCGAHGCRLDKAAIVANHGKLDQFEI